MVVGSQKEKNFLKGEAFTAGGTLAKLQQPNMKLQKI